ncbi:hypothetical protein PVAP13_1NG382238 [Panicum virgatum]|uniref:Uncharacterized protein n=1 Tax=Panicum virgatum TaxID=38727 RepID=A0A8T0WTE0_PANVG|nr:hypothetical protein PVAP13_1NG382238 [Panicum virgatum]
MQENDVQLTATMRRPAAAREGAAGCRRRRPDGGRRDREAAAAMNHERTSSKVTRVTGSTGIAERDPVYMRPSKKRRYLRES